MTEAYNTGRINQISHSAETLVAPFVLSIAQLHKRSSICFCFLLPFINWEAYILEKYDQYEILLNFIDKQMIFLSTLFVLNRFILRYLSVIHRTVFPFPVFLDRKFGFHRIDSISRLSQNVVGTQPKISSDIKTDRSTIKTVAKPCKRTLNVKID